MTMYTYACTPISGSLPKPKGDRVASFCSGGELGFALHDQYGVSVDILTVGEFHEAYMDIKRYAYSSLKESGFQTLMGMNQAGRRVFLYHQIREGLQENSRRYFDRNEGIIRTGLCQQFAYEKYLQQSLLFRPSLSSSLFPIWVDALGSRLHWIPFQKFRHHWRKKMTNIATWYENPQHFECLLSNSHQTRITMQLEGLYSDIYLFEPSVQLILESLLFLNHSGNLWVWSWKDLKKLNFQKKEMTTFSPCQPTLFLRRKFV